MTASLRTCYEGGRTRNVRVDWELKNPLREPRYAVVVALCLLAILAIGSESEAQKPGRNVNMVSGDTLPFGDPYLQRQNEPECAISTRNSEHIFCVGNDYRTVDVPGLPDDTMAGDAWIGVYMSFDGGESFVSTLVPGYAQDSSSEGGNSPLQGYEFAADPVVKAGASGLFVVSGLVADRDHGRSAVFVARYIDNNNKENGVPIRYIDTQLVVERSGNVFADKPSLAVDRPRGSASQATITTEQLNGDVSEIVSQTISCGTSLIAFADFTGSESLGTLRSEVMLTRSENCGESWSSPIRLDSTPTSAGSARFSGSAAAGAVAGAADVSTAAGVFMGAIELVDQLILDATLVASDAGLSKKDTDKLLGELDKTKKELDNNDGSKAGSYLDHFVKEVDKLAKGKNPKLTAEQADPLLASAQILIELVEGSAPDVLAVIVLVDELMLRTEETSSDAGLSKKDTDKLVKGLDKANKELKKKNGKKELDKAKKELGHFIKEVNKFVSDKNPKLTPAQGDPLVIAAQFIIDVINNGGPPPTPDPAPDVVVGGEVGSPNQGVAITFDPSSNGVVHAVVAAVQHVGVGGFDLRHPAPPTAARRSARLSKSPS